jgi:two-component system, NtrC family, response regulator HydG
VSSVEILVVDDEPGMRDTLVDILEGEGYSVAAAHDGDAALRATKDRAFDVIVMDIRMPGRDGVSVLEELGTPPPQIIMMTAYALEDRLRAAVEGNAYALVHKPFHVDHLLGLVGAAARRVT